MKSEGRIFLRGQYYWMAYYNRGREYRESTEETDEKKAEKALKVRLREVGADKLGFHAFVGPRQKRFGVDEMLDALEKDYKLRGVNSPQLASHLRSVREYFGTMRAIDVTPEGVDEYIEERLKSGARPATINRSTQLFNQAFQMAVERKHLSHAPKVRRLSEKGNERKGFFSEPEFRAVVERLPTYLQDVALFGYLTGWRKGEICSLTWEDVEGDMIHLRAENSKNGEPRKVPLEGELSELIERCKAARIATVDGCEVNSKFIFHCGHKDKEGKVADHGVPVGDFRKAWQTACRRAGVGTLHCGSCNIPVDAERKCPKCKRTWAREELRYVGKLFHDFRRSSVRNMVRAGVPERVAMSISGHKTRSVFDRYNITSDADLRLAMVRTQANNRAVAAQRGQVLQMAGD